MTVTLYGDPPCRHCSGHHPIGMTCPMKLVLTLPAISAAPESPGLSADLFNRACVFCWGNEYSYIAADALHILHRNIRFFRNGQKHIPIGIAKDLAVIVREEIARGEALLKELDACG